jgi:ABC-type antimicrobial peptide transport system permease subunit
MKPLSPFAYYRRHKRRALVLVGLICLATLGVAIMVRLLDFLFEQVDVTALYLTRVGVVSSFRGSLDPGVVVQIRAHPDVARVIPEKELSISVPLQTSGGFPVFGVREADLEFLMGACNLRLGQGRLLRARANEIMLSEDIAAALGLQIGDQISRSVDERYYYSIPTTMVLVGTLEDGPQPAARSIRLGLISYEYLESHEVYTPRASNLMIVAQEGRKAAVDRFLETRVDSQSTRVLTHRLMSEDMARAQLIFRLIFGVVDVLVAAVIALAVGTIHRLGLAERMVELALLHALGHGRKWLVRRLTLETAAVAAVGWIAGLALAWPIFAGLKAYVFGPSLDLDLGRLTPVWFSAPIPLVVVAFAGWKTMRTLAGLDAVTLIDRGELAAEVGGRRRTARKSSSRPLSSWTFYRRHTRRGLTLALTMALMIVGVAVPAFLFAPALDLNRLLVSYLRYISVVSPRLGAAVDPGVVAQMRSHPSVAGVVPALQVRLSVSVPPVSRDSIAIYGVSEDDLGILADLYGLQLKEGRFPDPRSNEIVLSQALAMNRGLRVGDKVGQPVYEDDFGIPTEMVVVGILSSRPPLPGADPDGERHSDNEWLGLAPYEYLSSHELYASQRVHLLLIPAKGRQAEMDAWLREDVASERVAVETYDAWQEGYREMIGMMLGIFGGVESVVAIVAVIALAVLSYIFFSQRKEEFGTLRAMGHSRQWLLWRTVGETVTLVSLAWLIGALVCMAGLIYMQTAMYAPRGLALDLFSPLPWLFTLPMPLAVVAVSGGLVTRMLARLDPVTIIERR